MLPTAGWSTWQVCVRCMVLRILLPVADSPRPLRASCHTLDAQDGMAQRDGCMGTGVAQDMPIRKPNCRRVKQAGPIDPKDR
jgi:hypothetical protein